MQFTVVSSHRASHQLQHQEAMAQGLRAHGIEPVLASPGSAVRTEFVACWGWRLGASLRQQGKNVLVMERGYLGDRFKWTSLAWNGLNGHGEFAPSPRDPMRFRSNFTMSDWNPPQGEYVLILGQVPGDASLKGVNMLPWYEQKARGAAEHYKLPVVFRPHPDLARKGITQRPSGTVKRDCSLKDALAQAHVAITFNSNSGVDAVLAGVPTLTFDKGSMAYEVTEHAIGNERRHVRDQWANDLAWKQWQLDEIADGSALTGLLELKNVKNSNV